MRSDSQAASMQVAADPHCCLLGASHPASTCKHFHLMGFGDREESAAAAVDWRSARGDVVPVCGRWLLGIGDGRRRRSGSDRC